jgi:hypothetical protein
MNSDVAWMVYHRNPDWSATADLPRAVFTTYEAALAFAKAQNGYGVGRDWFVREVALNPTNY